MEGYNWVNVDGAAKPFEEVMASTIKRWRELDQNLYHGGEDGKFSLKVKGNWKLAVENYCESYHLPTIHPELNKVSNINDHYHIQGLPNRFAGQGSKKYEQPMKGNRKFNIFRNWDKTMLKN